MKKFSEWMKIKEMVGMAPAVPGAIGAKKPGAPAGFAPKDPFLDRIKTLVKNDPKNAGAKLSAEYDAKIAKETKPAEIARLSKEKSDIMSALQGS